MNETTIALHHWLIFLFPRKREFEKCSFRHNATSSIQTVFITGQIINKVPEKCLHPQLKYNPKEGGRISSLSLYVTVKISFTFYLHLLFQERGSSDAGRFMTFVSSINSHKFRLTKIPLLPFHILFYHTEIFLLKKTDQNEVLAFKQM
jgi:hypothetical protein